MGGLHILDTIIEQNFPKNGKAEAAVKLAVCSKKKTCIMNLKEGWKDMKANLKRIEKMEAYLEECTRLNTELSLQLEKLEEAKKGLSELFSYYGSKKWYADREGELPQGFKAGVLSEDLIYDEIIKLRENAFEMLESATDILKNRI